MTSSKSKDDEKPLPFGFQLKVTDLGRLDHRGKSVTTCVVEAWKLMETTRGEVSKTQAKSLLALVSYHDATSGGLNHTDWARHSKVQPGTLSKAIKILIDKELVTRDGEGRGAVYLPTNMAKLLAVEIGITE